MVKIQKVNAVAWRSMGTEKAEQAQTLKKGDLIWDKQDEEFGILLEDPGLDDHADVYWQSLKQSCSTRLYKSCTWSDPEGCDVRRFIKVNK